MLGLGTGPMGWECFIYLSAWMGDASHLLLAAKIEVSPLPCAHGAVVDASLGRTGMEMSLD